MGQASASWCTEGLPDNDTIAWALSSPAIRPQRYSAVANGLVDLEELLAGCPRELSESLRESGQAALLRCKPWLTPGALRGLQRSLQVWSLNGYGFSVPVTVPWAELDLDHVISAGQVFSSEEAQHDKVMHLRKVGLQAIRQNKVGVVLLAGGGNWRLGGTCVGCSSRLLNLKSGKSIIQIMCERVRRVAMLCRTEDKRWQKRIAIPVLVMTSRLTHRTVFEHFEANQYFGLHPGDVIFFDQPVLPVLDTQGKLLPQSLGGEFAQSPGGTGAVLRALATSSALEQCRDRGVECLHLLGTENLLARVCDPVFIGFCRHLDVDCAAKVAERGDVGEDVELFVVRQSPVSTQFADVEDAAGGLEMSQAPKDILNARNRAGQLSYNSFINSVFMTVSYIQEVVERPVPHHKVPRVVPYLDFYVDQEEPEVVPDSSPPSLATNSSPKSGKASGLGMASWPSEVVSVDLACQRALLAAAAEIRAHQKLGPEDGACRCDVHLDAVGAAAVVRVKEATKGPRQVPSSLGGPAGAEVLRSAMSEQSLLRCSLVVPSKANAHVLESSILDYFAFTDRAVAFKVSREVEWAPVRDIKGRHTADAARLTMHRLHCAWVRAAGGTIEEQANESDTLEVSPLLSYEGEGLGARPVPGSKRVDLDGSVLKLPCHLTGPQEAPEEAAEKLDETSGTQAADGLDTSAFYLQEYPLRPAVSTSKAPMLKDPGGGW
ncbi:UDP-N-acetylhexosamine pyrophosphorylase-like protein 1 [Durusdinium trenchii]|uniref:UDP-N-acetylglucosamine diphosphorylase n=1 Tax=Durusdinium trenchii TaxID=1381693 RepID=A0ABP0HKY5_9DINO